MVAGGMNLADAEMVASVLVARGYQARTYKSTVQPSLYEVRLRSLTLRLTIRSAEEVPRVLTRLTQGSIPTLQEQMEATDDRLREGEAGTEPASPLTPAQRPGR